MRSAVILCVTLTLTACAHRFETRTFDSTNWKAGDSAVEGVIYYEPQLVKVTYSFTVLEDDEGNVIATADAADRDKKCKKIIQKEEIQVRPNFKAPRVLINKPGLFSSGKFGVNLTDGMLSSVNSDSTPIGPDLITALGSLATGIGALKTSTSSQPTTVIAGKTQLDQTLACKSAPVLSITPLQFD